MRGRNLAYPFGWKAKIRNLRNLRNLSWNFHCFIIKSYITISVFVSCLIINIKIIVFHLVKSCKCIISKCQEQQNCHTWDEMHIFNFLHLLQDWDWEFGMFMIYKYLIDSKTKKLFVYNLLKWSFYFVFTQKK